MCSSFAHLHTKMIWYDHHQQQHQHHRCHTYKFCPFHFFCLFVCGNADTFHILFVLKVLCDDGLASSYFCTHFLYFEIIISALKLTLAHSRRHTHTNQSWHSFVSFFCHINIIWAKKRGSRSIIISTVSSGVRSIFRCCHSYLISHMVFHYCLSHTLPPSSLSISISRFTFSLRAFLTHILASI